MSTTVEGNVARVVHGTQDPSTTNQTRGMIRRPGIDANTVGAGKIWLGHVTCVPNTLGPPHHRGPCQVPQPAYSDFLT